MFLKKKLGSANITLKFPYTNSSDARASTLKVSLQKWLVNSLQVHILDYVCAKVNFTHAIIFWYILYELNYDFAHNANNTSVILLLF